MKVSAFFVTLIILLFGANKLSASSAPHKRIHHVTKTVEAYFHNYSSKNNLSSSFTSVRVDDNVEDLFFEEDDDDDRVHAKKIKASESIGKSQTISFNKSSSNKFLYLPTQSVNPNSCRYILYRNFRI